MQSYVKLTESSTYGKNRFHGQCQAQWGNAAGGCAVIRFVFHSIVDGVKPEQSEWNWYVFLSCTTSIGMPFKKHLDAGLNALKSSPIGQQSSNHMDLFTKVVSHARAEVIGAWNAQFWFSGAILTIYFLGLLNPNRMSFSFNLEQWSHKYDKVATMNQKSRHRTNWGRRSGGAIDLKVLLLRGVETPLNGALSFHRSCCSKHLS